MLDPILEDDNSFTREIPAPRPLPVNGARARFTRARPLAPRWQAPLSQELFRDALIRERRRADRFEEAFVLLLISFNDPDNWESQWQRVSETVAPSGEHADVVGWYERNSVLGVIRPTGASDPSSAARALSQAIEAELTRALTNGHSSSGSIRLEVYSPKGSTLSPALFAPVLDVRQPRELIRRGAKRALDVVGGAAMLVTLMPIFAVVSALVRMTSAGPVFFRQQRVGRGGRVFTMLKFRTMYANADGQVHRRYVEDLLARSGANRQLDWAKLINDPRVTRVGHYLRRSSLDEVPQFWNVLRGDMSLVGPRPAIGYEVDRYRTWQRRRVLEVKPGMTGLWQVNGRSATTFDEMVRLDIRYAQTWSLWLDLKILSATPRAVLSRRGAL